VTDRDELAALINGAPIPKGAVIGTKRERKAYKRADAIIAAGWRPPNPDYSVAWVTFREPDGSMRYTTVASADRGSDEWITNGEVLTGYASVDVIL
jgi:hypothetical protein